jgi:signal transduction histidine kinase
MRFKTWPVAAAALAGLLLLVVVSVLAASRRAQEIYTQLDQLNAHHRDVDAELRTLRSDVNLSGIFVRDYLLDTSRERAPEYRDQLAEFRRTNMETLKELGRLTSGTAGVGYDRLPGLQAKLDEYWLTFEPLFDWTPSEKISESARFVRHDLLPRRQAVLAITREIEELNNANLAAEHREVERRLAVFRRDLHSLLWRSLLLGLCVALLAVMRLSIMERRADEQRAVAQQAEHQMRRLSQQLVAAQEEERKKLSRELHDHVGQMLTALRMELGRIDRVAVAAGARLSGAISECRDLIDQIVRTVRDLSSGLRPSMLDDLGLGPALEWLARDVTRRTGIPVDLLAEGDFDNLPESHRTCVYRGVQEALTNVLRHAAATRIDITVTDVRDGLEVVIADDGRGMDPGRRSAGLGLRGIEERVRELDGSMEISTSDRGTAVRIRLPRAVETREVVRASAVG